MRVQRIISYLKWRATLSRSLKKYKDVHVGQQCVIVGNGPSLNNTNLELLRGQIVFGLNKIHLLERRPFEIAYHVCVNKYVIEQSLDDMIEIGAQSFMPYEFVSHKKYPSVNSIFVRGKTGFSVLPNIILHEGGTVTNVALQLAFYMGFSRVILIGVDHSFNQKGSPNTVQLMEGEDQNHFVKNYFQGKLWNLADLKTSEESYRLAQLEYTADGREIVDCTVGGKLQIFPKGTLEDYV